MSSESTARAAADRHYAGGRHRRHVVELPFRECTCHCACHRWGRTRRRWLRRQQQESEGDDISIGNSPIASVELQFYDDDDGVDDDEHRVSNRPHFGADHPRPDRAKGDLCPDGCPNNAHTNG